MNIPRFVGVVTMPGNGCVSYYRNTLYEETDPFITLTVFSYVECNLDLCKYIIIEILASHPRVTLHYRNLVIGFKAKSLTTSELWRFDTESIVIRFKKYGTHLYVSYFFKILYYTYVTSKLLYTINKNICN